MMQLILLATIFLGLLAGTFFDLRSREVPDWVNYSLIFLGFGFRLLFSVMDFNFVYLLEGVFGFLVFFLIGLLMFYTGQWGGGDTKLLMGIGALMGLGVGFGSFPPLASFFVNLLLVGAGYGLLWSVVLAVKHRHEFIISFGESHKDRHITLARRFILITSALILIPAFIMQSVILKVSFIALAVILISTLYIWLFAKSVEKSCMFKIVSPVRLTEGDWIEGDIRVGRKVLYSKKDLGVSKEQIKVLVKYYKEGRIGKITVKEGIPFVPSFLIAYILTLFFGSWFLMFL